MKNRVLTLLLAAAMLLLVFAGCGSSAASQASAPAGESAASMAEAPADEAPAEGPEAEDAEDAPEAEETDSAEETMEETPEFEGNPPIEYPLVDEPYTISYMQAWPPFLNEISEPSDAAMFQALEEANTPSLDRPADTFARILQGAATQLEPPWRASAVGQILYHVGRWIYLVDAWDDLPRDKLSGSYNPILARFGPEAEEQKEYLRNTLHDSLGVADTAFTLLDWGEWETLLGHILGTGLPAVEEAVFTGQWKQKQKRNQPDHT